MSMLKIILADLRHSTAGRHNFSMPLAIGYIAGYVLSQFPAGSIDIKLITEPDDMLKCMDEWKPDIMGLSNFAWNSELSRLMCRIAKRTNPDIVCILGGAEFPVDDDERKEYLAESPEIDLYVYGDGELAFSQLVQSYIASGRDLHTLRSTPRDGAACIHPDTGELLVGTRIPRLIDMDVIPSPYVNGLLDPWFVEGNIPAVQFTRGCPFTCKFCCGGHTTAKRIGTFGIERIKEELLYIAKRIQATSHNRMLQICDTNWGMYKRDEEIAEYLRWLMDTYEWPMAYDVNSGKENHERIMKIAKLLQGKFIVTISPQSLNQATLTAIKRKNVPLNRYFELVNELENIGQKPPCELIIPLPEETKESHLSGLKVLIDNGIYTGCTYTTMMLKGTALASREYRQKYSMKTKYRVVPRQFGEYRSEKCFETEEVCIQTNTMPFEDYLDCRGFAFMVTVFTDMQYDIIQRHIKELKLSFFDFIYDLWQSSKSQKNYLSDVFVQFMDEAAAELFDSKKAIYDFFSDERHYQDLLTGRRGDNLLRKYRAKSMIEGGTSLFELAYATLLNLAQKRGQDDHITESLEAAKNLTVASRNMSEVFGLDKSALDKQPVTVESSYDVFSWYADNKNDLPLTAFKKQILYTVYYESDRIKGVLEEGARLHGKDTVYMLGKLLVNWKTSAFWKTIQIAR